MDLAKFNAQVKPYFVAYKSDVITQHEFIVALNFLLNENKVRFRTMVGEVVIIERKKVTEQQFNKWIVLPEDDLIVDFCLRDVLDDSELPFGVFTLKELNAVHKKKTYQYRGSQTGNETSRDMMDYINQTIETAKGRMEKAQELSKEGN